MSLRNQQHLEAFICVISVCGLLLLLSIFQPQLNSYSAVSPTLARGEKSRWTFSKILFFSLKPSPVLCTLSSSLCSFIPCSYPTVQKIIHPLPLLPWQLEGKSISSASSSRSPSFLLSQVSSDVLQLHSAFHNLPKRKWCYGLILMSF